MEFGITFKADFPRERMTALTRQAEAAGFTYGWVFDSHVLWQESYPLLTLMALNTERMRLGTCVTNPLVRTVDVTASALATPTMPPLIAATATAVWGSSTAAALKGTKTILPPPLAAISFKMARDRATWPESSPTASGPAGEPSPAAASPTTSTRMSTRSTGRPLPSPCQIALSQRIHLESIGRDDPRPRRAYRSGHDSLRGLRCARVTRGRR
ncbi:MAG: LLM class flavin-dependent oxidoreductase, partial [SAR324 cluster bacterium]|nr:LLM class flavin-dependent oxidoreductase [SAR324 cluster bacterium]